MSKKKFKKQQKTNVSAGNDNSRIANSPEILNEGIIFQKFNVIHTSAVCQYMYVHIERVHPYTYKKPRCPTSYTTHVKIRSGS